jgi:hypothetical protein
MTMAGMGRGFTGAAIAGTVVTGGVAVLAGMAGIVVVVTWADNTWTGVTGVADVEENPPLAPRVMEVREVQCEAVALTVGHLLEVVVVPPLPEAQWAVVV